MEKAARTMSLGKNGAFPAAVGKEAGRRAERLRVGGCLAQRQGRDVQETHGKRLFLWPVTEAGGVRLTGEESKHAEHPSPAALTLIRRDAEGSAEGSAGLPKGTLVLRRKGNRPSRP